MWILTLAVLASAAVHSSAAQPDSDSDAFLQPEDKRAQKDWVNFAHLGKRGAWDAHGLPWKKSKDWVNFAHLGKRGSKAWVDFAHLGKRASGGNKDWVNFAHLGKRNKDWVNFAHLG